MVKPTSALSLLALASTAFALHDSQTANAPTSSNSSLTFEMRQGNDTAPWTPANVSSLGFGSGPVSWRIAGDNDSSVHFTYNSSANLGGYEGGDDGMTVKTTVNTTYGASTSKSLTNQTVQVPFQNVLRIKNFYCANDQNFTAYVELTNGTIIRKTWINDLTVHLPSNTQQVIVNDIDLGGIVSDNTTIKYQPWTGESSPIIAEFGAGSNVPTLSAEVYTTLVVCDEDD